MKTTTVVGLALLALLGTSVSAVQQKAPPPQGEILQRILVKVNGEIFTQTELEQRQIQALQERQRRVQAPEDLKNDAMLKPILDEITPTILVEAVDELLLIQRGRELGNKLSDEQFKRALDGIKKDNKLDDAGLKAALAQEGLTMEQLRENLEKNYLVQAVQQKEIMQHANLTEEEARQYYDKHPDEFRTPPTVTLREILVAVATQTQGAQRGFLVGADDAAKAKIETIRQRLVQGEDFAKVAAEVSEAASKESGGLIGPVNVTEMTPALVTALEKMKPGEITEPIRTTRGYQIFKLETRTESVLLPFDQVRDELAQKVYEERLEAETKKYLLKLRQLALIEWKDDTLKQMYEKRVGAETRVPRSPASRTP